MDPQTAKILGGTLKKHKGKIALLLAAILIAIVVIIIILFLGSYKIVHFVTIIQEHYLYKKLVPYLTQEYITAYPNRVDKEVASKYGIIQTAQAGGSTLSADELDNRVKRLIRKKVVEHVNDVLTRGGAANQSLIDGITGGWLKIEIREEKDSQGNITKKAFLVFLKTGGEINISGTSFGNLILQNEDAVENNPVAFLKRNDIDWDDIWEDMPKEMVKEIDENIRGSGGTTIIDNFRDLASFKYDIWSRVNSIKEIGSGDNISSSEPGTLIVSTGVFIAKSVLSTLEKIINIIIEFFRNLWALLKGTVQSILGYTRDMQWFITADKIKNGEFGAKIVGEMTNLYWEDVETSDKYKEVVRSQKNPPLIDRLYVLTGQIKSSYWAIAQTEDSPKGPDLFNELANTSEDIAEKILDENRDNLSELLESINKDDGTPHYGFNDYVEPYDRKFSGWVAGGCNSPVLPIINDESEFAKAIDDYIPDDSPLNGLGSDFVKAGQQNGVNPAFIVAIAKKESSFGTTGIATQETYNSFGRTATVSQPHVEINGRLWYKYESWQQSLDGEAQYLKEKYLDQQEFLLNNLSDWLNGTGVAASYPDQAKKFRADYEQAKNEGLLSENDLLLAIIVYYAPPSENDTIIYTLQMKKWISDIMIKAGSAVDCGTGGGGTEPIPVPPPGSVGCTLPPLNGPNSQGYYQMPDSPYYTFNGKTPPDQRWGRIELIQITYCVAKSWAEKYPANKLKIGDLNAPGHDSHKRGIDVDIFDGPALMANPGYNPDLAVELAQMFFMSGKISFIFYNDLVVNAIVQNWADSKGLPGIIEWWKGHEDHFHVRINP